MTTFPKLVFLLCIILCVCLLYIPFYLVALKFNTVRITYVDPDTREMYNSDNFAYPFSILVWPTYAFFFSFLPFFYAVRIKLRWYFLIPLAIAFLFLWDSILVLDTWLGLPGGGNFGLNSYPANNPGINTQYISVVACPFALLAGVPVAILIARINRKEEPRPKYTLQSPS